MEKSQEVSLVQMDSVVGRKDGKVLTYDTFCGYLFNACLSKGEHHSTAILTDNGSELLISN